jgi:hypothetical protein
VAECEHSPPIALLSLDSKVDQMKANDYLDQCTEQARPGEKVRWQRSASSIG